jgi:hypothetical protein
MDWGGGRKQTSPAKLRPRQAAPYLPQFFVHGLLITLMMMEAVNTFETVNFYKTT